MQVTLTVGEKARTSLGFLRSICRTDGMLPVLAVLSGCLVTLQGGGGGEIRMGSCGEFTEIRPKGCEKGEGSGG